MKKRICILLAAVFLVAVLTPGLLHRASADTVWGYCGDNLKWVYELDKHVLSFLGTGDMDDFVDSAPGWYDYRTSIEKITLPDGLTSIGYGAFEGCSKVTEITVPDGVARFRVSTFKGCSALKKITFTASVKDIEHHAFDGCSSLQDVFYKGGVPDREELNLERNGNEYLIQAFWHISSPECGDNLTWTFNESTGELKITGTGNMWGFLEDLPPWYDLRDKIKKVTLPNGLTNVSSCAFIRCSNLKEITLPDGVTYIGIFAFRDCSSLQKITFTKSVKEIRESAFSGCTSLKDVYYKGSVIDRDDLDIDRSDFQTADGNEPLIEAFWHISSPECGDNLTWTFNESTGELKITGTGNMWGFLEDLPPWYDLRDKIKKVTLPNGLTNVSSCAFIRCSNLKEITLPDGVTYIGIFAFRDCSSLQKITFTKSVTEVMESAFSGCTSLKDVYYYGTPQDRSGMRIDESYDQTSDGNDPLLKAEWHFQSAPIPVNNAKIVWNQNDVSFKGSTAYVIYNKKAQTPRFSVTDANGTKIDASNYTYEFKENTKPGTGYLFVTFTGNLTGSCSASFKIYLPATEWMTVENVAEGIKLTWAPVDGAAGYVIYRRARNTTTNQWTDFARWNNTTETSYIDGADSNHRVYIGSRYQYGVKAYFARRLDPIANQQIGGNVNDNSGNWNLGEIGPLKTMVRITTRKLISVTSGKQQLTVNWDASKNFTGYDIQLATDAAFTKNVKTERVDDWKTASKTIKGLKSKTTYYVRVRSYQKIDSMTYFGQWSNVLSAKTR